MQIRYSSVIIWLPPDGGISFDQMLSSMGPGILMGRNKDPDKMYEHLYRSFLRTAFEHGPTPAHLALARLEEMGKQMKSLIPTCFASSECAGRKKTLP